MKKFGSKRTTLLFLTTILLVGCETLGSPERREQDKPDVVLRPGKVYEECLPLTAPQVLAYSFSSSKPLEFNIHYHGDKAVYPVESDAVETWKGVFDPTAISDFSTEQPPFFCLMWTNPHEEEVGLNYDYLIRDKE